MGCRCRCIMRGERERELVAEAVREITQIQNRTSEKVQRLSSIANHLDAGYFATNRGELTSGLRRLSQPLRTAEGEAQTSLSSARSTLVTTLAGLRRDDTAWHTAQAAAAAAAAGG